VIRLRTVFIRFWQDRCTDSALLLRYLHITALLDMHGVHLIRTAKITKYAEMYKPYIIKLYLPLHAGEEKPRGHLHMSGNWHVPPLGHTFNPKQEAV
jgi:hypothetical protein